MIRNLLVLCLGVLIVGCANTQETIPIVPKSIPTAWAQQPEEKGSLPVGRVIAIERYHGYEVKTAPYQEQGPQLKDALIPVVIVTALLAAPVMLALHEAGNDTSDLDESSDGGGNVYRHSIRLNGTDDMAIRDEFWTYNIGDCVALRSNPEMLVPALPGECK